MKPVFRSNMFALSLVLAQVLGSLFLVKTLKAIFSIQELLVVTQIVFLIIPLIIYFTVTGLPVKETLRFNKISIGDIGLIIVIAFLCQPVATFLSLLTSMFFNNIVNDVFKQLSNVSYPVQLGLIALTPAICEEMTMRGIVLSGYRKISNFKAALMTGLLFGILHMNMQQFLYAFILGILLAYLVLITNSIFASMTCHFMFNAIQVTTANIAYKLVPEAARQSPDFAAMTIAQKLNTVLPYAFSALIFSALVFVMVKKLYARNQRRIQLNRTYSSVTGEFQTIHNYSVDNKSEIGYLLHGEEQDYQERVFNVPFILTVLVFLVIMFLTEYLPRK